MCTSAAYVSKLVGTNKSLKKKELCWKRWLEERLKQLNRNLGFVNMLFEKKMIKKKYKDRLEIKCNIQRKKVNIFRKEMKQQIKDIAANSKRYKSRINQYQQNWIFVNNQGQFSQQLSNKEESHQ